MSQHGAFHKAVLQGETAAAIKMKVFFRLETKKANIWVLFG